MTAVNITCPKCGVKMQLDEAPAADEAVECPKCEHQFTPAAPPPAKKPLPADMTSPRSKNKKKGKGKKADQPGKKKGVKKKKSNPFFLTLMIGGALAILACVGGIAYLVFGASTKVPEMLSYCPADSNVIRGCNVGLIARYPGYYPEATKQINYGPVKDCSDAMAKATGADPENVLDYFMVAKVKGGRPSGTVVVLRSREQFDIGGLAADLGQPTDQGGVRVYRPKGKSGAMANAAVLVPNNRLFIVVEAGPGQEQLVQQVAAGGPRNKANMLDGKLTRAGRLTTNGHIWTLIRCEGEMANYNKEMAEKLDKSFKPVADQMRTSKTFGLWMSFGAGGYRVGGAIDCADADAASAVADSLATGPISKGDDSEVPRDFRSAVSIAAGKDFLAYFLGNIKFKYTGDCAYFETKIIREKAGQLTDPFNKPSMGENR